MLFVVVCIRLLHIRKFIELLGVSQSLLDLLLLRLIRPLPLSVEYLFMPLDALVYLLVVDDGYLAFYHHINQVLDLWLRDLRAITKPAEVEALRHLLNVVVEHFKRVEIANSINYVLIQR